MRGNADDNPLYSRRKAIEIQSRFCPSAVRLACLYQGSLLNTGARKEASACGIKAFEAEKLSYRQRCYIPRYLSSKRFLICSNAIGLCRLRHTIVEPWSFAPRAGVKNLPPREMGKIDGSRRTVECTPAVSLYHISGIVVLSFSSVHQRK